MTMGVYFETAENFYGFTWIGLDLLLRTQIRWHVLDDCFGLMSQWHLNDALLHISDPSKAKVDFDTDRGLLVFSKDPEGTRN